jgi:hypothetical protein
VKATREIVKREVLNVIHSRNLYINDRGKEKRKVMSISLTSKLNNESTTISFFCLYKSALKIR